MKARFSCAESGFCFYPFSPRPYALSPSYRNLNILCLKASIRPLFSVRE
jgi:hypothetical protein